MRKPVFSFSFACRMASRFAVPFCLGFLLTALVCAPPGQAQAAVSRHRRRAHAVSRHSSAHYGHRPSPRRHSVHRASHRAYAHRVARHRRRRVRATHRQRVKMEAMLDRASTHTPMTEDSAASIDPVSPAIGDTTAPTVQPASDTLESGSAIHPATARLAYLESFTVPHSMPLPLRGSHEVLVHQNVVADVEGLSRIQDESQLNAMVQAGDLVALPASAGLEIDPRLPYNRRYCRPWAAKFLRDLSHAHESVFGTPLQLTSAVRTVTFQRRLARYNGNAAPTSGDTASPHLTGEAIDIGKKGMSWHEIAWMRDVLGHLQAAGKIDVEEEFEQACFHISVYRTYTTRSAGSTQLIARNDTPDAAAPATDAGNPPIAPATLVPVSDSASAPSPIRLAAKHVARHHRRHRYYFHRVRHTVVRRRRRHHRSLSLIAAGLR